MRAVIVAACHTAAVATCLVALASAQSVKQQAAPKSNTCQLVSGNILSFGNYDPLSDTAVDDMATISYRCGKLVKSKVQISLSTGGAGMYDRYMRGGSGKLRYNLYLDSLRTQIWGDGTSGTEVFTGSASTGATAVPVFGRVFGSQDVSAAIYIDTVIVTLDF